MFMFQHRSLSLLIKVQRPLLFQDLFHYVAPNITSVKMDWDNIQEDLKIYPAKKASHTSFEHCKAACEADKLCLQFVYDGTECALSHHIRLGGQRQPRNNEMHRYTSGWNIERIWDWTKNTNCASAHWVKSNP